ncbi:MAG: hypothetical protein ACREBR_01760, partial [bacterium]
MVTTNKRRPKKRSTSAVLDPVSEGAEEARRIRSNLQLTESQSLLLAIGWVTDGERRLARMYPEVFMMDVTSQTNSEKRDLFIVAGKDNNVSGFTAARVFIPSEKQWVFRWIYSNCLPLLLGEEVITKTKLVLTDGDTDMYSPLHLLIKEKKIWGNCMHGLCYWHLSPQGWRRLVKP